MLLSRKKTSEKKKRENSKMTQGFQSQKQQWSELIQRKGKFMWCHIKCTLTAAKVQVKGEAGLGVLPNSPGEDTQGQKHRRVATANTLRRSQARDRNERTVAPLSPRTWF